MEWLGTPGLCWFCTLTYNDHHLPMVRDLETHVPTLEPKDMQEWLWRWRKRYGRVRYFYVGEYGDTTHRPHYHVCLFGQPADVESMLELTWRKDGRPIGHVQASDMNVARARYVAQYAVKKLSKSHGALGARYPEFTRMSRGPPLGSEYVKLIAKQLLTHEGSLYIEAKDGLVPKTFRHEGKQYPIGRYWRLWLAEETGYAYKAEQEEELPEDWEIQVEQARAQVREAYFRTAKKGYL